MATEIKQDPRIETARLNIRMAIVLRRTDATNTSREAGLSQNALGSFLRGKSTLSFLNVLKVCEVLDIPLGVLQNKDGITPARIRLYKMLEGLPEHELDAALAATQSADNSGGGAPA